MGQQLNNDINTWSPLGLFPTFGQAPLESPQVVVLVDIKLAFFVNLDIISFSIGRRSRFENTALDLVDLLF